MDCIVHVGHQESDTTELLSLHCMWVLHGDLLLSLPWRIWVCPSEGQVWRQCCCLCLRNPDSTRYSGEPSARAAGHMVPYKVMATHYSILAWRIPQTEKSGRSQSTDSQSWTWLKWCSMHGCRTFLASGSSAPLRIIHGGGAVAWIMGTLAMLTKYEHWWLLSREITALLWLSLTCGSSAPVKTECNSGAAAWVSGTLAVPSVPGHWLSQLQELWPYQSFSILWQMATKGPLWLLHPFRHLKSTLAEVLLCCWALQALKVPTFL